MMVLCNGTETLVSSLEHSVHIQTQSIPEDYNSDINNHLLIKFFYFRVVDREGCLQLKRKLNARHKSSFNLIRSTFCPIMSFRQGACIGKVFL